VSITSKIEDLPPWFELHPTEVSGYAACLMMQNKLDSGYKPKEPIEGPNLWRVMAGDRIVWISRVETQDPVQTIMVFGDDALVFGERGKHQNDIGWFLSFGASLEGSLNDNVAMLLQAGVSNVRKLGLPREIGDSWRLSGVC
jgi:hypothetical protein